MDWGSGMNADTGKQRKASFTLNEKRVYVPWGEEEGETVKREKISF